MSKGMNTTRKSLSLKGPPPQRGFSGAAFLWDRAGVQSGPTEVYTESQEQQGEQGTLVNGSPIFCHLSLST